MTCSWVRRWSPQRAADDDLPARQALAQVVVGFADQGKPHARRQEGAKAIARADPRNERVKAALRQARRRRSGGRSCRPASRPRRDPCWRSGSSTSTCSPCGDRRLGVGEQIGLDARRRKPAVPPAEAAAGTVLPACRHAQKRRSDPARDRPDGPLTPGAGAPCGRSLRPGSGSRARPGSRAPPGRRTA